MSWIAFRGRSVPRLRYFTRFGRSPRPRPSPACAAGGPESLAGGKYLRKKLRRDTRVRAAEPDAETPYSRSSAYPGRTARCSGPSWRTTSPISATTSREPVKVHS
jgi:hypothetical protein